jgi:hypothetical protein
MIFLMHDKKIYVFMQKKSDFSQIKYLKFTKSKIKLKKTTFVFISCSIFVRQLKICEPSTDK